MNKTEAKNVISNLFSGRGLSWREQKDVLHDSGYPELAKIYYQWLLSSTPRKEFEEQAVEHIMIASTKLYKALK